MIIFYPPDKSGGNSTIWIIQNYDILKRIDLNRNVALAHSMSVIQQFG
jgi:hypothetical protein